MRAHTTIYLSAYRRMQRFWYNSTCFTGTKVQIMTQQERRCNRRMQCFRFLETVAYADVCSRMLTYAHVCSRMLTYAHVCSRMMRPHVSSYSIIYVSSYYLSSYRPIQRFWFLETGAQLTCFTGTKVQILTQVVSGDSGTDALLLVHDYAHTLRVAWVVEV
jgi:hypothetical protein